MIIFHILVKWNKNSECCGKAHFGGNEVENLMVKVRNLSGIQQEISFTELDFCQRYEESFKTSEFGRIKSLLLLLEMSVSFALIGDNPKSLRTERDRKAFFTPEGRCVSLPEKLTGVPVKKLCGVQCCSVNANRTFCKENGIETSFTQKGRAGTNELKNAAKRELASVRATTLEGSFGTQKEHSDCERWRRD